MYRVPVLNFNSKPFNGEKYDNQVLSRASMWSSGAAPDNDNGKGKYDDRNQIEKKDEIKSTHFISIPIALNTIDIQ